MVNFPLNLYNTVYRMFSDKPYILMWSIKSEPNLLPLYSFSLEAKKRIFGGREKSSKQFFRYCSHQTVCSLRPDSCVPKGNLQIVWNPRIFDGYSAPNLPTYTVAGKDNIVTVMKFFNHLVQSQIRKFPVFMPLIFFLSREKTFFMA